MGIRFERNSVFHFKKESFVPLKNLLKLSPRLKIINVKYEMINISSRIILNFIVNNPQIIQLNLFSLNFELNLDNQDLLFIKQSELGNFDQVTLSPDILDIYRDII